MMSLKLACNVLDYLKDIWGKSLLPSFNKSTFISFYGGEPLLNVPFIESVIAYLHRLDIKNRSFQFSMTTNALLLDRYMDFLVEHSFYLLISLDGDKYGNSYRVRQDGTEPFDQILRNLDLLKEKYPDYFDTHLSFNAVLHNRNSVSTIFNFIHDRYGKIPRIAELNTSGIKQESREDFENTYRNKTESLWQSEDYESLEKELYMQTDSYSSACLFLHRLNDNVVESYNDFFESPQSRTYIPTGTCTPFAKKIFVTVNGKILPCERIGHHFSTATVTDDGVCMDINAIVDHHNRYLDKLQRLCSHCLRAKDCSQCFYNIDTIDNEKPVCDGFSSVNNYVGEFGSSMNFFETHPEAYNKLMTEIVIS